MDNMIKNILQIIKNLKYSCYSILSMKIIKTKIMKINEKIKISITIDNDIVSLDNNRNWNKSELEDNED